nr:unnamed protein product [Callosobruchus analis]
MGAEEKDCIAEIHLVNNLKVSTMSHTRVLICATLLLAIAALTAEAVDCFYQSFTFGDDLVCYKSCTRACQRVGCDAIGCNENVCYCK